MSNIEFKGFADYSKIHRENERMRRDLGKMKQQLRGIRTGSKGGASAAGQHHRALRGMVTTAGSLATAFGGVRGAISLVTEEIQSMMDTQRRAKEASMTVAEAQIKALRNVGATSVEERKKFTDAIAEMSAETGVSQKDLYLRAGAAYSAKGPLSTDAAMQAVELSAQLVPEDRQMGTTVAGAALDIAKITQAEDMQANLGLMFSIGQKARIEDIGRLAKNLPPAMTAMTAMGDSAQEAGATFAAITTGMADPTGEQAKTAMISFSEQLAKFLPEETTYKYKKTAEGVQKVVDVEGTGLASTMERIEYLQGHEQQRQRFLGQASFEKASAETLRQILRGEGPAAVALEQNLQALPSADEAAPLFRKRLEVLQGGELQKTAAIARTVETQLEQLEVGDQGEARTAIYRDFLQKMLKSTGATALEAKSRAVRFEAKGGDLADFRDELYSRQRKLLFGGDGEPTEREREQARILGETIQRIEGIEVFRGGPDRPTITPEQASKGGEQLGALGDWFFSSSWGQGAADLLPEALRARVQPPQQQRAWEDFGGVFGENVPGQLRHLFGGGEGPAGEEVQVARADQIDELIDLSRQQLESLQAETRAKPDRKAAQAQRTVGAE